MTDLNANLIKLKSGEVIIANLVEQTVDYLVVEYPGVFQMLPDGRAALLPAIPAIMENFQTLMKQLVIDKKDVFFYGTTDKRTTENYADFMLKTQSSFSGLKIVSTLGELNGNNVKNIRSIK